MRDINSGQVLGFITQGSLSDGLEVRLYPDISVEDMRVGKFLIVQGVRSRFFCMLTDVTLGSASLRIVANPPVADDDFLREVLGGSSTFGTIALTPMLMFTPSELSRQDQGFSREELEKSFNGLSFVGIVSTAKQQRHGTAAGKDDSQPL